MSPSAPSLGPTTCVLELTPAGRAAVSVVLVEGPTAIQAVDKCFSTRNERRVADSPVDRITVGRWGGPAGEELVVCKRGAERVEVHCHGGTAAVRSVMNALVANGCCEVAWRDWLRRSHSDPIEAAARIALADAVTARTAAILLDQLNGALATAVRETMDVIAAGEWNRTAKAIGELLNRRELGLHLTSPWRVVLAGPPNVGKSSLINALAGYERAIVAPTPGTTRDVVTVTTAIEGWPVELADTAGLRATEDELESAGVELAQATLATADLVVFVQDATQSALDIDQQLDLQYRSIRHLHVWNKVDLLPSVADGAQHIDETVHEPIICTSALTGRGIAELAAAIATSLVPNPPPAKAAVPFMPANIEALVVARNAVERRHATAALEALQSLLASDDRS